MHMFARTSRQAPEGRLGRCGAALCAVCMGFNLVWCTLMGHTAGFASLAWDGSPVLNPRLLYLLGIAAAAAVCALAPGHLRHADRFLRFALPVLGLVGTACFAPPRTGEPGASLDLAEAGLFVTGVVYFWIVARCVLVLARVRGIPSVITCLAGGMAVRFPVSQAVALFASPTTQIVCAMLAPVVASLAFESACFLLRRDAGAGGVPDSLPDGPGALGSGALGSGALGSSALGGNSPHAGRGAGVSALAGSVAPLASRTVFGIPQRADLFGDTPQTDRFSMCLLLFVSSVLLAVTRCISSFGLWGDVVAGVPLPSPWLSGVLVPLVCVLLFALGALGCTERFPLAWRFQPALLLTLAVLFAAGMRMSPLGSDVTALSVAVQVGEAWAHILFWTVVATALGVLGSPSYRVIGAAGLLYAVSSGAWMTAMERVDALASLTALLAVYVLVVISLCAVSAASAGVDGRKGNPGSPGRRAAHADADGGPEPTPGPGADSGAPARKAAPDSPDRPSPSPVGPGRRTDDPTSDSMSSMLDRCAELAGRYGLSPRETEVFTLLVQGRSRSFIQEELYLSGNTVKTHVTHIYAKMGVRDKQGLMSLIWGK